MERIFIENEKGKTECDIIAVFTLDDVDYIALLPVLKQEEILIFKYIELNEDTIEIISIDNTNEFEKVLTYFDNLIE